jgi:uncharacterized protein (TIGR02453 family)
MTASVPGETPSFAGFPPDAMTFLGDLRANNRREWFAEHRAVYERAVRAPAEALASSLAQALSEKGGQAFAPRIFRLHRDVRFSKDKSPYNAHLHIAVTPERPAGAAQAASGFYFGLDPDRLQLGAGVFELKSAALNRLRTAVADPVRGPALAAALARIEAAGFRLEGPMLKRTPAPYPPDHPRAGLLRYKGLTAWREVADRRQIEGPGLLAECLETFDQLARLHAWLMDALTTG